MRRILIYAGLVCLQVTPVEVRAQKTWTLEECIAFAHNNNLQVKRQQLQSRTAVNNFNWSRAQALPTANAFANYRYNKGRAPDFDTYTYVNRAFEDGNMGIESRLDFFNGLSGYNTMQQSKFNLLASLEQIESLLKKEDLHGFLKEHVKGDLKFHHEFRVTLADCPNACSQPQIKDIGIIGACSPQVTAEACSRCDACVDACKEDAIALNTEDECPQIDYAKCLHCGKCMQVCPSGTIVEGSKGFRVQLGGKLGRHPSLAKELPAIYSEQQVLEIVKDCLDFYMRNSKHGARFAQILKPSDFDDIAKRHTN